MSNNTEIQRPSFYSFTSIKEIQHFADYMSERLNKADFVYSQIFIEDNEQLEDCAELLSKHSSIWSRLDSLKRTAYTLQGERVFAKQLHDTNLKILDVIDELESICHEMKNKKTKIGN